MTYCVALAVNDGLVFLSDTRTNAGVDHVSAFRKMQIFEQPGERVLVLMSAGNLAITQAVVQMLKTNYAPITELRSAVIWTKGVSGFIPDYSVDFLPTNPWIHQPFEGYDSLRPAQLLEKWKV